LGLSFQKEAIRDGKVPSQAAPLPGNDGMAEFVSVVVLRESISLKVLRVVDLNLRHAITSFGISAGDRCIILGLADGSLTACGFHWGLDAFTSVQATQM
jgi:hypothetical protein